MTLQRQLDLLLTRLLRLSSDQRSRDTLNQIRTEVLLEIQKSNLEEREKNQKKIENHLRIVFFNKCDEFILRYYRQKNPIWRDFLHIVYHRQFLRIMVESQFWKKGYITREEREYMEEITEEVEDKLLSHAEHILTTAVYLRCYVKRMVRNITTNYWNRKMIKKQMICLIEDQSGDQNEFMESHLIFADQADAFLNDQPDSRMLQEETEVQIRKAFLDCMEKMTPWQKRLIEISLDPEQNLYAAYERGKLVESALEEGVIKRRYTYQAVKNHANAALKLLRHCMTQALET